MTRVLRKMNHISCCVKLLCKCQKALVVADNDFHKIFKVLKPLNSYLVIKNKLKMLTICFMKSYSGFLKFILHNSLYSFQATLD